MRKAEAAEAVTPRQDYTFSVHNREYYGEWMRLFHIKVNAPVFRFAPLCDLHWGSPTCREVGIRHHVQRIQDEQIPWVSVGDLLENNIPGAAGLTTEQVFMPGQQYTMMRDLLKPIAHLNIGAVDGNHEYRSKRAADIPLSKLLFENLGIGGNYFNISWVGIITLNHRPGGKVGHPCEWVVWGFHGSGGGSTPGGKLNAQHKVDRIVRNPDLVISGHHHNITSDMVERYQIGMNNRLAVPDFKCSPTFYQACGAGLNYLGSYAHRGNMAPSVRHQVIIEIGVKRVDRTNSDGKRVEHLEKYQNRELVPLI